MFTVYSISENDSAGQKNSAFGAIIVVLFCSLVQTNYLPHGGLSFEYFPCMIED
jgi:hypothetical protein